jgi:hypothetical protein
MPEIKDESIPSYVTKPFNLPLPEYADEAAALAAGLSEGTFYRTATGEVRVKLPDP